MNIRRIKAVLMYSWFHLTHSLETWVDLVWFPFIEIIVFGLLAYYIGDTHQEVANMLIMGLVFWEVIRVIQYSITINIMWDIWSSSFSTLFVSPLQVKELIIGQAISGILKSIFIYVFLGLICLGLYGFNVFSIGWMFFVYLGGLALFGISAGVFIFGLIVRFGTDIQSLSWSLIFLFQPISAVVYPVEALPIQVRWLAYFSPVTYVMEALRQQVFGTGQLNWQYIGMAYGIGSIYVILSGLFTWWSYTWAKRTGAFARLEM